jgi:hypothetical protein
MMTGFGGFVTSLQDEAGYFGTFTVTSIAAK